MIDAAPWRVDLPPPQGNPADPNAADLPSPLGPPIIYYPGHAEGWGHPVESLPLPGGPEKKLVGAFILFKPRPDVANGLLAIADGRAKPGCSKCRYLKGGCAKCVPNFKPLKKKAQKKKAQAAKALAKAQAAKALAKAQAKVKAKAERQQASFERKKAQGLRKKAEARARRIAKSAKKRPAASAADVIEQAPAAADEHMEQAPAAADVIEQAVTQ